MGRMIMAIQLLCKQIVRVRIPTCPQLIYMCYLLFGNVDFIP